MYLFFNFIQACSQNLKRISDEIGFKDMGRSRERGAQAGLGGMVWPCFPSFKFNCNSSCRKGRRFTVEHKLIRLIAYDMK